MGKLNKPNSSSYLCKFTTITWRKKTLFSELFINKTRDGSIKVLYDSWLAEDGGRLYLKRNKGILLEVDDEYKFDMPNENFIWLSLYQIKTY